jgi:O-succinylbenzoic acid--CoA ligase
VDACRENRISLTSLVPTQLYDLVANNLAAPTNLRAVLIGGSRLSDELYFKGRSLGWPLLPSFGMTEASSQIATALPTSLLESPDATPSLTLLSHLLVRTDDQSQLSIAGPSLLEGYYELDMYSPARWCNPKDGTGWYQTQDCVEIRANGSLNILARVDDVIKIRGECINLASLRSRLEKLKILLADEADCTIVAVPHQRLGHQLLLVGNVHRNSLTRLASHFNESVLPFERLEDSIGLITIPRTSLGKIHHGLLIENVLEKMRCIK